MLINCQAKLHFGRSAATYAVAIESEVLRE
jgi:hypothetical protein